MRLKIDHGAFDVPSAQTRYWIGFLLADGCLTLAKRKRKDGRIVAYKMIALQLCHQDRGHVLKFKQFLGAEQKITDVRYASAFGPCRQSRFSFISEKIWDALTFYNLTERKSKTVTVHPDLKDDRDFWRGVVDGDGSVMLVKHRNRKLPMISLTGNLSVVQSFKSYALAVTGRSYAISRHPSIPWFARLKISSSPAVTMIKELYTDAVTSLDRKLMTAMTITERTSSGD